MANATPTMPGASNAYVPAATEKLVIDFGRNVESFAVNNYVQIVPVTKDTGLYPVITVEQAGRVLDTNLNDAKWSYGNPAPKNNAQTESFVFLPYATQRYQYGFNVPTETAAQASWDLIAQNSRISAQRAMTARTQLVISAATTTANYPTGHFSAVASISGNQGKWDESTTARSDIKRSLNYGKEKILLATLGAVNLDEIILVMSPGCARKISESQEIIDYIKGSPQALEYIRGDLGPNARFGLPQDLFGTRLVIENAVKTTNRKGATKATSYVLADTTPFLCSRPGGLEAPKDSNNQVRFSTLALFMYEEMTVEAKHDEWDRLHNARVVENFQVIVTAGLAGFLFTSAVN